MHQWYVIMLHRYIVILQWYATSSTPISTDPHAAILTRMSGCATLYELAATYQTGPIHTPIPSVCSAVAVGNSTHSAREPTLADASLS
ncbi:uncharacterized protein Nmag_3619 (plasmid) [Natrialba magadii ATCC 43099]|uniref:Uncharacterized protein n=1 Tax=Natrialba magadii (strain ATCC 43099 / DSM 3394 / CCM 3739 / CIP 104546 / IAM 13178 / JCM 8861 / NBRC 102185 / NCIMB 2190 / MS3) TaxID=547559 RepID=D3T0R0_NATMM|nr:uncharacterized protein Nmag_3619 [Natrialba magadii ATCC 43099]